MATKPTVGLESMHRDSVRLHAFDNIAAHRDMILVKLFLLHVVELPSAGRSGSFSHPETVLNKSPVASELSRTKLK